MLFTACNLESEVELELPVYESQPVVEAYLEPGKPFRVLITRSAPYFEPVPEDNLEFLESVLLEGADVQIRYDNQVFELENSLFFDPDDEQLFNYILPDIEVPYDTINIFELDILLPEGTSIQAKTRMLRRIPIDSVVVEFEEEGDTLARVLTYFTDTQPDRQNFVRRTLHWNSLDSIPEQDFAADDRFVEEVVVFGSGFDYPIGDTIINTIYHVDSAYYDYLQSIQGAIDGNLNPFVPPSPIISNMEGDANALGIFTSLIYSRDSVIIQED